MKMEFKEKKTVFWIFKRGREREKRKEKRTGLFLTGAIRFTKITLPKRTSNRKNL